MFYQPIVPLVPSGSSRGGYFEALVRIRQNGEWIMPSNIFQVVDARRLDVELDRAVLSKVIEDLRGRRIPPGTGVSINLSGPSIVHEQLVQWFADFRPLLHDYRIVIEITETVLITQLGVAERNLSKLREMGFEIALDDFGSGYSSLRSQVFITRSPRRLRAQAVRSEVCRSEH